MRHLFAAYKPFVHVALRRVWLLYSALALAVLAPLLKPGYILTLDMVFAPKIRMPKSSSNDYLFRVLLHSVNSVLASDVIEKALLFVILLLSGVGLHRLVQYINRTDLSLHKNIGAYAGGVLYMINPFTYDRFMAGQYEVLLGYALLPWFVLLLLRFLAAPGWTRMLRLVGCAVAVSIVSIHSIGLLAILSVVALALAWWQQRADAEWRIKTVQFGLLAFGLCLIASSYWLVPLLLGNGSVAAQIKGISAADQSAFATVGGGVLGKLGNIVRLQGFWVEARGMYDLPQARVPAWGLIGLMIWALVAAGGVSLWRSRRRSTFVLFAVCASVGCLLAVGVLSGAAAHAQFLAGYREPEKFVALLALAYAMLAARGAAAAATYFREQGGKMFGALTALLLLALPFVWTPTMAFGFAGQLKPVQYPADWQAVNARLNADDGDFQTLFLPWHLYMQLDFAGRIIASPAPAFFDKPVIVSDNPEFRGAALSNPTAAKQALGRLLSRGGCADNLSSQLASLRIKYVIVTHDDDYRQYGYLAHCSGIQPVSKGATLDVYRNEAYREE